jgi:hypothetical protein
LQATTGWLRPVKVIFIEQTPQRGKCGFMEQTGPTFREAAWAVTLPRLIVGANAIHAKSGSADGRHRQSDTLTPKPQPIRDRSTIEGSTFNRHFWCGSVTVYRSILA